LIKSYYPDIDLVAGTATAGIPHAAFVAEKMQLPMCYVRSSAKSHGKGKQIEGLAENSKRAVVIEDLISTGKSSIQACQALRESGIEVAGVVGIFSYGLQKADEAFKNEGLSFQTATNFSTLIKEAEKGGTISNRGLSLLNDWQKDPENWETANISK
jgi:orotate phosphoribosyltransferase